MKYIYLSIFTITLLLAQPINSYAQDVTTQDTTATQIESSEVKGEVLKVEGQKISVESNDQVTEYMIPGNVQVSRNSLNAQVSDLKPGDNVTLKVANGQILSIGATSETVTDSAQVGIPIILGALLLGLIAYTLWKKSTREFIKTDTVKLQ